MAELTINVEEIAAALKAHVSTFTPSLDSANVGQVLEVGDGIARVAGLPETSVNEVLEFEGGTLGLALNLDEASIGAVVLGDASHVEEGGAVKATGRILSIAVGDALIGRVVDCPRAGDRRQGPDRLHRGPSPRGAGAGNRRPPAGARAAADRHQGHRRHDPRRPWPAGAHHRRPQDRQDHRRDRHDPRPEGPGREVHLRRDRPEGLDRRADRRHARGARRHGLHGGRERARRRLRRVQVPRPLRRVRDRPALDGQRRARARRLRRPLEAGRVVPSAGTAAASPAGS